MNGGFSDHLNLADDFKKSIQYAFDQADAVRRLLAEKPQVTFYDSSSKAKFTVESSSIDHILILCITPTVAEPLIIDMSHFLTKDATQPYPLALSLHDFETIARYLSTPERFLGYLKARQPHHGRVVVADELDFAGYYYKFGHLNLGDIRMLQQGFSSVFDREWYRQKGIRVPEPEGGPVLSSMRRDGAHVTMEIFGEKPRKESFLIPAENAELFTGHPLVDMKGPDRNSPCPCGSGRKLKRCHGQ